MVAKFTKTSQEMKVVNWKKIYKNKYYKMRKNALFIIIIRECFNL